MDTLRIQKLKLSGINAEFLRIINSELWLLKQSSEDAAKDGYKNIESEMGKAKECIDNVLCLYGEYKKSMAELEKLNNKGSATKH